MFVLHNIEAVKLHGKLSMKQHQTALKAFQTSSRVQRPCVPVLSYVSVVGLNLICTNIIIMVMNSHFPIHLWIQKPYPIQNTTWSALNDEQLYGQIYRFPQQKQVHIYHLIILGTPNIFLNNISFGKGQMHAVFVSTDPSIHKCFYSTDNFV